MVGEGKIVSLLLGAILPLRESGLFGAIVAELRKHDGKPELRIGESSLFRRAIAADEAWLAKFRRLPGLTTPRAITPCLPRNYVFKWLPD